MKYAKRDFIQGIGPVCELAEYHWFHREKVELYMAELFNKIGKKFLDNFAVLRFIIFLNIGVGLMTWSPVSYGLCLGGPTESVQTLFIKLYQKVRSHFTTHGETLICCTTSPFSLKTVTLQRFNEM